MKTYLLNEKEIDLVKGLLVNFGLMHLKKKMLNYVINLKIYTTKFIKQKNEI